MCGYHARAGGGGGEMTSHCPSTDCSPVLGLVGPHTILVACQYYIIVSRDEMGIACNRMGGHDQFTRHFVVNPRTEASFSGNDSYFRRYLVRTLPKTATFVMRAFSTFVQSVQTNSGKVN
jgi:hypothetical protein